MYNLGQCQNTSLSNKNIQNNLKLHDLKHFENLLQNKYQENEKICLNTSNTQKKPQLLTPTNGNKNTIQEIKKKYFQKRGTNVTEYQNIAEFNLSKTKKNLQNLLV